jgi:IS605 OrfB family transposase
MSEKKIPVTFRLKKDHIYISYDEKIVESEKKFKNLFNNRVLGIDLNPNYFGISIIEFNKNDKFYIIHKEVIDLNKLQEKSKNKIHYELYEINHYILKLCKQWHVGKLAIEDLKFKSDKFWNKDLNRLCRNKFRYSFVKQHLNTLCNVYGVELIEVNAAYSSIIGNFKHGNENTPDMIAASIEIARRSYKKFEKG